MSDSDSERNRIGGRVARYARVGTNMAGVAAGVAARRVMGGDRVNASDASAIARSLGQLKGPLMKVAQLLSTIPEAVPAEYAAELAQLQSDAPPMGWAFVKRRMRAAPGVQQCYYATGEADFIIVMVVKDIKEYEEFTQEYFFDESNVSRFTSSVVMDRVKVSLDVL